MVQDGVERTERALDALLADLVERGAPSVPSADADLDEATAQSVFRAMVASRALDVAARRLRADGRGYYTISSAGHEHNALVGHQLRPTDPAFLHYRSGAFVAARRRDDLAAFVRDTVASLQASTTDPVAAGRHKVWGSREHWIPPQTSTIASHVPKAVGTAIALGRAATGRLVPTDRTAEVGPDPVVCVSLGDASLNHATTSAGLTMARWARRQGAPVPVLFVCEDNGLGISVPTPRGWVEQTLAALPGIAYVRADGDLGRRWAAVRDAVELVRGERRPVALHLPTVRLWGHAGSDVEEGYRTRDEVAAAERADPLLSTARWLVGAGLVTGEQLLAIREEVRELVGTATATVPVRHAGSSAEVMGPLLLDEATSRLDAPSRSEAAASARVSAWAEAGLELPEDAVPPMRRTLGARLNQALHDLLLDRPEAVLFGEDVASKGGVYGITAGLHARFGTDRVFDTLLDETSILGAAQGFGLTGHLPIPEVQYLAYLHNALDQVRGEAASTAWLSDGAFTTPMVLRVAAFAYQRGFGGHFHNDNAIGALRDIPGLLLATPSRGDDAARLLRASAALAADHGRVVAFLEPIALYHQRDLHDEGDDGWLTGYPAEGVLPPGTVGVFPAGRATAADGPVDGRAGQAKRWDDAADVVVVTYANGVRMARRAAARLLQEEGIRLRVLDLRWLQPLPMRVVVEQAREVGRVLVVDECRATGGGIADAVVAGLVESGVAAAMTAVRALDSYVPLGPAAEHVLVTEDDVVEAARQLGRTAAHR